MGIYQRYIYGRMMSAMDQMPRHIQRELGLDTLEARQERARAVAYDKL